MQYIGEIYSLNSEYGEKKMKVEPAVTFREMQFLFSGSCKKVLTLKRPEA